MLFEEPIFLSYGFKHGPSSSKNIIFGVSFQFLRFQENKFK